VAGAWRARGRAESGDTPALPAHWANRRIFISRQRQFIAAERGVKVHVLCGGRHGTSDWDILDTFASLRTLRRFGVKVPKQKNLRVHANLLIADNTSALVGSVNIDRSAFDLRRELGITTTDLQVVQRLGGLIATTAMILPAASLVYVGDVVLAAHQGQPVADRGGRRGDRLLRVHPVDRPRALPATAFRRAGLHRHARGKALTSSFVEVLPWGL